MTKPCKDCGKPFEAGSWARWGLCCRWKHRSKRTLYIWTPERDAIMRERYDGRKGCGVALAELFGFPRWVVNRRAVDLGLTQHPKDRRPWTPEEERFLEANAGVRLLRWIAKKLGRSVASVGMKLKHNHISCRIRDGYTLRDLEVCFGVDHKTAERWLSQGRLTARRRHGGTAPAFARDAWRVTESEIRRFVRENPNAFRLDRVDQLWFLGLVFGRANDARLGAA